MKKIYLGLLVALITFCTSCEFSETIYINEDGSGNVSFYLDGSELVQMAGTQMTGGQDQLIDTAFTFKDLLKMGRSEISKLSKEEKRKLKDLEKLNMKMLLDTEKGKFNFDISSDFNSVTNLQGMFDGMNSLANLAKESGVMGNSSPIASMNPDEITKMEYSYKNNVFKRSFRVMNKKLMDSLNDNLGQAKMVFAASTYKLNYNFPRKIKSVSLKDATIGEDGKSFVIKINAMEFMNNPEVLNFEVELEK